MTPAHQQRDAPDHPILEGDHSLASIDDRLVGRIHTRFGRQWGIAVVIAAGVTALGAACAAWLLWRGVGVWGVNVPDAWGFAIVNFVWWIGIGHAGTLISAILLLLRQSWRNSINRFAEAMTLFAVLNAAIFPILHLGRYWKFYYLLPYPNPMGVWPQWRSPLVWDAFAVGTYALVSVLFWWLGLIPDLATLRDRDGPRWSRRLAAIASVGWCGEARQWARLRTTYLVLAGLATALVISVHSIVSLDFAVSIVPGWSPTIFPPYFVAGAIFSGMAMVLTLAIPLRAAFRLKDLITPGHLDLMAKVMLTTGLMVGYGYLMEVFVEWLSASDAESYRLHARLVGHGAAPFWATIACNVLVAQALWFKTVRRRPLALFIVSLIINLGMWLERYDIVLTSLERDYLPSAWRPYAPTFFDWGLLIGTLGLFSLLFLLFLRVLPASPAHEVKKLAHETGRLKPPPINTTAHENTRTRRVLVEFDTPTRLRNAARVAAQQPHARIEAYSPFPIDGIDKALGAPHSKLPRVFFLGGLLGLVTAYATQYFAAVIDYPWIVAGKPYHSWPSFIPITYEVTILGAATAGMLGFLVANRFPRLHQPLLEIPGFERATRDRFWLLIEHSAPRETPIPPGAIRAVPLQDEST